MSEARRPPAAAMPAPDLRQPAWCKSAAGAIVSLVAFGALALAPATRAQAQAGPIQDASVEEFRDMLVGGATSKAFRRTLPPTEDGLCPGAGNAPVAGGGASAKNFVVVPFAPTGTGFQMAVEFANASDLLTGADQRLLAKLAIAMRDPQLARRRFAVAGHTDATGDDKINLELSCARSLAVKRFLVAQGVTADRLSAYGFGSSRPLEPGVQASSRNRRVEVRAHDGESP